MEFGWVFRRMVIVFSLIFPLYLLALLQVINQVPVSEPIPNQSNKIQVGISDGEFLSNAPRSKMNHSPAKGFVEIFKRILLRGFSPKPFALNSSVHWLQYRGDFLTNCILKHKNKSWIH